MGDKLERYDMKTEKTVEIKKFISFQKISKANSSLTGGWNISALLAISV